MFPCCTIVSLHYVAFNSPFNRRDLFRINPSSPSIRFAPPSRLLRHVLINSVHVEVWFGSQVRRVILVECREIVWSEDVAQLEEVACALQRAIDAGADEHTVWSLEVLIV